MGFVEDFINKLRIGFPDYTFDYHIQGGGWCRAFILYNGISLGRFNFEPNGTDHKLYGYKHYKPHDYNYEKDDDIFYLWDLWVDKEVRPDISKLVPLAQENRMIKINQVRQWRKEHPKPMNTRPDGVVCEKSRARISTNWMGEFRKLVEQEKSKYYMEV